MNIKLSKNYYLKSDKNNFVILKKDGEREFPEGFYSSIEDAIRGFIFLKIKGFDSHSINELLLEIKDLKTHLNRLFAPFKIKIVGCENE